MWTLGTDPQYQVRYRYCWWGLERYVSATVSLRNWGTLYVIRATSARAAYKSAQRAIRAFQNYGDVEYNGKAGK